MSFTRKGIGLTFFFVLNVLAAQGQAQSNSELLQTRQELEQLKQEYDQMKSSYEERLTRLDERLKQLEGAGPQSAKATTVAFTTSRPATAVAPRRAANAAGQQPASAEEQAAPVQTFQEPTDSMQMALAKQEDNATRERMERVLHEFVDISGYFRAGYGRDDEGGPQVGFQAPGALAKGRLGNEPENYGEIAIGKSFYLPGAFSMSRGTGGGSVSSAPVARVLARISMYNPYQSFNVSSATQFGIAEAWGAIGNLSASQPSMNVWAGNRFYRRHDMHVNDFMMYNMSGGGGGVEDIKTPAGKLAFAWIGLGSQSGFSDIPQPNPGNLAGFSKQNFDFRFYDFKLPGGTGEFGFDVSHATSGKDQTGVNAPNATGVSFTLIHIAQKWAGENNQNKFYLQYGRGPAKTFTSGFETYTIASGSFIRPDASDSYRFRVGDELIYETGRHFSVSPVVLYQDTDYKQFGGQIHWFEAGVRPQAHLNNYVSLAVEPFVDWTDNKSTNVSDYLMKMTFAPQISLGPHFMSRPVIRAFVTYAQWGNGFKGSVGGPDYLNSTSGLTWGAQMESWW
ncbi:MAG TPA: carbohydrate porin [Terracidiphilus sp.]|nr:carbohydrate porin [Terracidiphilus sp.]